MDAFASMNISVAVTVRDQDTPQYLANMVEYCLGGAGTTYGAMRIADGHPAIYQPYAWEIGNEQVNFFRVCVCVCVCAGLLRGRGWSLSV